MIGPGDLVWYDEEVLALVLETDVEWFNNRRVLILKTNGDQRLVFMEDLRRCE